jgi:hypothetical protein
MMMWYYLSFADESGWLGACFVKSLAEFTAIAQAHIMGVNPGGEVQVTPLPDLSGQIPSSFFERLLDENDLRELDKVLGGDGSLTTDIATRRERMAGA